MTKLVLPIFLIANLAVAAEVPKSPYIAIVYRYADAICKNDETYSFGQNDLRILYTLSELSTKPKYRLVADDHVKWLLQNPAGMMEEARPWMLWDRCFDIDRDRSRELAEKVPSIRGLAAAYQHSADERFLKLIESELIPAKSPPKQIALAIDAWGAAARLPQPLATKLRQFAESQDVAFLAGPNQVEKNPGLAMLCLSRYENSGNVKYRHLIIAAADGFKDSASDFKMSPIIVGHIVSLELAAWRSSARQEYLDAARQFADLAIKNFWTGDNALPAVTTGADSLVLSLLELHLSILHITAVRCPPNTIDR